MEMVEIDGGLKLYHVPAHKLGQVKGKEFRVDMEKCMRDIDDYKSL